MKERGFAGLPTFQSEAFDGNKCQFFLSPQGHRIELAEMERGAFQKFFDSCRKVIIPEMNFQGQYAALMKARYGIRPIEMHFPGVLPVSPLKIAHKIKEVQNEFAAEAACVGSA